MLLCCALAFAATFPTVNDLNLIDVRVKLPGDIGGGRAAILVSYLDSQQEDMQFWAERFLKEKLPYFEVPLVGEVGPIVEAGMRIGLVAGRAPERREHVVPVFEEPPKWKDALESDGKALDVLVVSGTGAITVRETGEWDEKKWARIAGALR